MSGNEKKWDVNQILTFIGVIIALLGLVVAVIAVVVTVTTPELRHFFGLEEDNPPVPSEPLTQSPMPISKVQTEPSQPAAGVQSKQKQSIENPMPPSGPFSATLHENQPQLIDAAKTSLTAAFYNNTGAITAKLTITPDIKEQITLPTVGIGSKEFASSTGVFLVHIFNVDWNSRTITVQVSRK